MLAAGAGAAAAEGCEPVLRTWTFSPMAARSLDSATASRRGRLGRTTTPSRAGSVVIPLAESFAVTSARAAPPTNTSYLSEPTSPGGDVGPDKYDVFVGGAALADVTAKLSAKGLTTEPARDGVVVRPSLPLRDAVALSKDLAAMGLKVQVRRSGAAASPASTPAANPGGDGLHRVRVGPYPDRAAATSALKELEAKGYKPFLARR